MKLAGKILICFCALCGFLCSYGQTPGTQQPYQFRTVFGRFAINLPSKYSQYELVNFEIAKYKFPVRLYRWQFEHEVFTLTAGEGTNNLEKPEYTKLFLDDLRSQYSQLPLKENGTIIDDGPWSYDGHPGWQIVERHKGVVVDLRFFVIGYRFFTISVAVNDDLGITKTRQDTLDSFHLLSDTEVAEEKERLIESFAPPALPQQPSIKRSLSDAQEENLRGSVKRVYVEEADYLGRPQPSSRHPRTREDFDQEGYLVAKIQYLDFMPYKAFSYGYMNGSRAYSVSERPVLVEQLVATGTRTQQPPDLYRVEYKYGKSGALEEMKASGDKSKVEQVYEYHDKPGRREITFSEKNRYVRELSLQWKSEIQLDKVGNPAAETRMEYTTGSTGKFISTEKQVDSYTVVSNAIRGEMTVPANGVTKAPSVADIVKNPNLTERTSQPEGSGMPRLTFESTYSYTYEYDSHGNWIKRIQSLVKKADKSSTAVPVMVTYRTITYY